MDIEKVSVVKNRDRREELMMPKFEIAGIAFQIVNLLILASWLVLMIVALFKIRDRQMKPIPQVLWTMLVILIPILGPLAFLVVSPGETEA